MTDSSDYRMIIEKSYSLLDFALRERVITELEKELGKGWIEILTKKSGRDRAPSANDRRFLLSLFNLKFQTPETREIFHRIGLDDFRCTQLGNLYFESNKFAHQDSKFERSRETEAICSQICGVLELLGYEQYAIQIVETYKKIFDVELNYIPLRLDSQSQPQKKSDDAFLQKRRGFESATQILAQLISSPNASPSMLSLTEEEIKMLISLELVPSEVIERIVEKIQLGQSYIQVYGGTTLYNTIIRVLCTHELKKRDSDYIVSQRDDTAIFSNEFVWIGILSLDEEDDEPSSLKTCRFSTAVRMPANELELTFTQVEKASFKNQAGLTSVELFELDQFALLDEDTEIEDGKFLESGLRKQVLDVLAKTVERNRLAYRWDTLLIEERRYSLLLLDTMNLAKLNELVLIEIFRNFNEVKDALTEKLGACKKNSDAETEKTLSDTYSALTRFHPGGLLFTPTEDWTSFLNLIKTILNQEENRYIQAMSNLDIDIEGPFAEAYRNETEPSRETDIEMLEGIVAGIVAAREQIEERITQQSEQIYADIDKNRLKKSELSSKKDHTDIKIINEVLLLLDPLVKKNQDYTLVEHNQIIQIFKIALPGQLVSDEEFVEFYKDAFLKAFDQLMAGQKSSSETPQEQTSSESESDSTKSSSRDFSELSSDLKQKVIGQDNIIDECVGVLKVDNSPLKEKTSPTSFLFAGPTGTGKTYLAEQLAEGINLPLLRIDMSEFNDTAALNRLIGSPPGYMGSTQDAQLVKWVKDNPKSVLVFDEIDKAEPNVLDILLQILDKGEFSSGRGDKFEIVDSLVICTTNASQAEINKASKPLGFSQSTSSNDEVGLEGIRKAFRPELINRFRKILVFNNFTLETIEKLVHVKLDSKFEEWKESFNLIVDLDDAAYKAICVLALDDASGARELNRIIDMVVINKIIDLLSPDFDDKQVRISFDYKEGSTTHKRELLTLFNYEIVSIEE